METRKTTALTTVITGLRKFTNYSLQVLAFTKVGDGILTNPAYCQTEEDGKTKLFIFHQLTAHALLIQKNNNHFDSSIIIIKYLAHRPILRLL